MSETVESQLHPKASKSLELSRAYLDASAEYRSDQEKWYQFTFGEQWSKEVRKVLEDRSQAPISFNYLAPAVDQGVATLTAKSPSFACTGRDDSDVKFARVASDFLSYVWYTSEGDLQFSQIAVDYYTRGLGWMVIYPDPDADGGRGELKLEHASNREVIVDPASKHPLFDDAESIIQLKDLTGAQFIQRYPQFADLIKSKKAKPTGDNLDSDAEYDDDVQSGSLRTSDTDERILDREKYRLTSRYTRKPYPYFRIQDARTQDEKRLSKAERDEFMAQTVYIITTGQGSQILDNQAQANTLLEQLDNSGIPTSVQVEDNAYLLSQGYFKEAPYNQMRIELVVDIGGAFMYEKILPISRYPLIPFPNMHTGTPRPLSDVSLVVSVQEFANKMISLVVAHTQATSTLKLLLPKGSVDDVSQAEADWQRPDALIEYDGSYGEPHTPMNPPLSTGLFNLIQMAKSKIESQFGIWEMNMGNGAQAPDTYKGTMAMQESQMTRMRGKLRSIERSLARCGKVVLEWSADFYTEEKMFKLMSPTGEVTQGSLNIPMYDDKGKYTGNMFDLSKQEMDLIVLGGSTLPSNRWAEYETYKDAYMNKIIDQEEVLKKTEIFDRQGVLERTGRIQQMTAQLQQYEKELKKLTGDLQTATRESEHDRKQVVIEKFRADLEVLLGKFKQNGELDAKKMELEVEGMLREIGGNFKQQDNQDGQDSKKKSKSPKKDSAKSQEKT